jgi:hypothetical protein
MILIIKINNFIKNSPLVEFSIITVLVVIIDYLDKSSFQYGLFEELTFLTTRSRLQHARHESPRKSALPTGTKVKMKHPQPARPRPHHPPGVPSLPTREGRRPPPTRLPDDLDAGIEA